MQGSNRFRCPITAKDGILSLMQKCMMSLLSTSRLKCSLNVEQLVGDYVRYCATLTCNTRPDQNPPLLSINGETTRPSSTSYSGSEGKEEYVYRYYFNSEGYKVACEKLTFGGKAYKLRPRKCKKRH